MLGKKWRSAALCFMAISIVSGAGAARYGKDTLAAQKLPKLKVATRLVEINVVVDDKNGKPVSGLTQKDFSLFDGGHQQTISLFTPATSKALPTPPLAMQPDVYTNLLAAHGGIPPSTTIILLDGLNTALTDQSYARAQVLKFLSQIQPQDHVALYALGTKLTILQDFTTDASNLVAALGRYKNNTAVTTQSPEIPTIQNAPAGIDVAQLNAAIGFANQDSARIFQANRAEMTIAALDAIARHAQGLPGRKNLIWVSGQFPVCFCFSSQNPLLNDNEHYYANPVEQTAQLFADANVSVYPVDAHGLLGPNLGFVVGPGFQPTTNGLNTMTVATNFLAEDMANWTGGLAFSSTNDIMGSIRRAVDDADVSYVLGYYPAHNDWEGEFRKIKVKVDQRGLKVRAREGYFAMPDLQFKPKDITAILALMASSPLDATGIGFAARITPIPTDAARAVAVTVRFDPQAIRFTSAGDSQTANIQYAIFELDRTGKIVGGEDKPLKIEVSQAAYQSALKEGMAFSATEPVVSGAVELCILLRDNSTGAAGSLHIPLDKYISDANQGAGNSPPKQR
ncbi:MAG: VWA domain-containing protein [Candidatus Acidiferrales bacterium]